ncbi:sensor histidine kinase [Pseudomonas sp. LAM2023]|uniref:sensor histidine kinase n=1 Tax=Pseudomonas sp. LAM2023 TaxID=2800477 RepID=UPI00190AA023|nr:HAMP domain-containing sensor histidine kinase [Pseudomonas sp. LAM2023]
MKPEPADFTLFLISNITHQAINPLNGVIGTLDNVVKGDVAEHKIEQRLKSARAQLEYTVSLIRNLSYFAEYAVEKNSEKKPGPSKKCVIPEIIIQAAQFFQEQGRQNGIRIQLEDAKVQNCVPGDPDLIRQVFMNLFDNAVKYGNKNSQVLVKNWIQKKTQELIVTIEGTSTPFDTSDDIFGLGARGKKAEEKTSSGSGLGLYICRLIVENVFNGVITGNCSASGVVRFELRIPNAYEKSK